MHKLLCGHSSRLAVVLHRLRGIRKTQLASEYVKQHKEKYTATFWLNANNEDSLQLGFRSIAWQILKHYPLTRVLANLDLKGDLYRVVKAVKAWFDLRENTRWLIVYNNYDNLKTFNNSDSSTVNMR